MRRRLVAEPTFDPGDVGIEEYAGLQIGGSADARIDGEHTIEGVGLCCGVSIDEIVGGAYEPSRDVVRVGGEPLVGDGEHVRMLCGVPEVGDVVEIR